MVKVWIAAAACVLLLSACAASGGTASTRPAGAATPRTVSLRTGFTDDPYKLELMAGGNTAASTRAAGCVGYISDAPDLILNFTAGNPASPLYIFAYADADTTLVVRTPSGTFFCNDDDEVYDDTLDPWITISKPVSGTYSIWVGAQDRGVFPPAKLYISEIDDDGF